MEDGLKKMSKLINLKDKTFGKWKVLEISERKNGRVYWKCECCCGITKSVSGRDLKSGASTNCGCQRKRFVDLSGKKFGKLTVLCESHKDKHGKMHWLCECSCGNKKAITTQSLNRGATRSCGCLKELHKLKLAKEKYRRNLNPKLCKIEDCKEKHHSKGFCQSHYNKFYKKLINEEGQPINGYQPKPEINLCRFPGCNHIGTAKSCLRNGLCNKHRKWAEKGIIDKVTFEVLKPDKIPKIKQKVCRLCDSKDMKGLGLCKKHYRQFKDKIIDENGNRFKPLIRYGKDFKCKVTSCYNKGRFVKGFCLKHYDQHLKGILNENGRVARELKKVPKYSKNARCINKLCDNRPRVRGFCEKCFKRTQTGTLDLNGNPTNKALTANIGKKCKENECNNPAYCKELCLTHYKRLQFDYQGPEFRKNVGQTCSEEGCDSPAVCRSMCSKHYVAFMKKYKFDNKEKEIVYV
jgi:hypothetical protein